VATADGLIELGPASAVEDGGDGLRFDLIANGVGTTGFVIRYGGQLYGYVNRCAHVAMELDWQPGHFFDGDGTFLVCSTHGALYEPTSGTCAGGPCGGRGNLRRLDVFERDGRIYWRPDAVARSP
jgi:nitrite reductase/ring-hydroxylating ferredoxin subunit